MIRDQSAFERRIERLTKATITALDVGWLKVNTSFDVHDGAICECRPRWQYREADLSWCPNEAALLSDEELRHVLVHELTHALIAPVCESLSDKQSKELEKLIELSTENVTRVIFHLWRKSGTFR